MDFTPMVYFLTFGSPVVIMIYVYIYWTALFKNENKKQVNNAKTINLD
ncbi:MAG: hypothetical protein ACOX6E_03850 [Syntrophomonadaceae bacterium]|jgi:cbb3-type cytochrome oxidase subunit 3